MHANRIMLGDTVTVHLGPEENAFLSGMTVMERPFMVGGSWLLKDDNDTIYEIQNFQFMRKENE